MDNNVLFRGSVSGPGAVGSNTSPSVTAPVSAVGFTLSAAPHRTIVPGELVGSTTIGDREYNVINSATYYNEYTIVVQNEMAYPVVFESLNTDVAEVDEFGNTTRIGDGTATIKVYSGVMTKYVELNHTLHIASPGVTYFTQNVAGSLRRVVCDAVDLRIEGISPDNTLQVYTVKSGGVYTRNTDCWAAEYDMTGISPWNSLSSNKRSGTLIAPDIVIFAQHYRLSMGTSIRFVKQDGTVVTRTVVSSGNVSGTDIGLGRLDEAVPVDIVHYKIVPTDVIDYLSGSDQYAVDGLPTLGLNQFGDALITDVHYMEASASATASFKSPSAPRSSFYKSKVVGDSGCPAFLIVGEDLGLITCWHYGGAGSGPWHGYYLSQINDVISAIGGSTPAESMDLGNYQTYS